MVSPPSKFYKFSFVFFHKDVGDNVTVTNFISHFSKFFPTKAIVKLANLNTVHSQVIGIVVCCFPNGSTIYLVVTVYYFPGHPSNTISSGALKTFMLAFKRLSLNLLNIVNLLTLKVILGDHPNRLKTISTLFKSKLSNSNLK